MSQKNPKTPAVVLHEFADKNGSSRPQYVLLMSKTDSRETEFHFEVTVANVCGIGVGRSKKVAKHRAASHALELLADQGLYDPSSNPVGEIYKESDETELDIPLKSPVNYIGTLKEYSTRFKIPYSVYTEVSWVGPQHCRKYTYECKVSSIATQATAKTKKQAKQLAAKDMAEKIKKICPEVDQQYATNPNTDIYPNRKVLIKDYGYTIKKIMFEKILNFSDFEEQFKSRNKEGIDYICSKLNIKCKIEIFQEDPPMSCAQFGLDKPFTVISTGTSKEDSENNLIQNIYKAFETYMDISEDQINLHGCNVDS